MPRAAAYIKGLDTDPPRLATVTLADAPPPKLPCIAPQTLSAGRVEVVRNHHHIVLSYVSTQ